MIDHSQSFKLNKTNHRYSRYAHCARCDRIQSSELFKFDK